MGKKTASPCASDGVPGSGKCSGSRVSDGISLLKVARSYQYKIISMSSEKLYGPDPFILHSLVSGREEALKEFKYI